MIYLIDTIMMAARAIQGRGIMLAAALKCEAALSRRDERRLVITPAMECRPRAMKERRHVVKADQPRPLIKYMRTMPPPAAT